MHVWILSRGERHEGGEVIGVYADKAAAFTDFAEAARDIRADFALDDVQRGEDGGVHIIADCDRLSLEPHQVRDRPQIGADR